MSFCANSKPTWEEAAIWKLNLVLSGSVLQNLCQKKNIFSTSAQIFPYPKISTDKLSLEIHLWVFTFTGMDNGGVPLLKNQPTWISLQWAQLVAHCSGPGIWAGLLSFPSPTSYSLEKKCMQSQVMTRDRRVQNVLDSDPPGVCGDDFTCQLPGATPVQPE